MPTSPVATIIICTRNHRSALIPTLESLAAVELPDDLPTELIIVDNGSSDNTVAAVAAAAPKLGNLVGGARIIAEPRTGKSFANNTGIAAARGEIILFTDDDLRFPPNWMDVSLPIRRGDADAVGGGVRVAPHLLRPWMQAFHRSWLAGTEEIAAEHPRMIGANFAVSRRVLETIPRFDEELGPGQLGFGEDILFGLQLLAAGLRVTMAQDIAVEHHCDADRLRRGRWLSAAIKLGRTQAYHDYHWEHRPLRAVEIGALWHLAKLRAFRLRKRNECRGPEGISLIEAYEVMFYHYYRHWRVESRRTRLYDRHGAVKHGGS